MGTPIFLVKRASNSQDTVDYIVQRAARKNSSGFPGLILTPIKVMGMMNIIKATVARQGMLMAG